MKTKNPDHEALATLSIIALACIIFSLLFEKQILLYIAACLLIIGNFLKQLSRRLSHIWLRFAHFLGTINTKVILSIIFFLLLTPLAALYRMIKGDFLNIKRESDEKKTCWTEREHQYVAEDFENVW
jgi:predicted membrane protein